MDKYKFPCTPIANPQSIISGPNYRFTILTDRLLRYEWTEDGQFEDRASTLAVNRDFPVPDFKIINQSDNLEIITPKFHLSYDKQRFRPGGFLVESNAKTTDWGAPWRFGIPADLNLGGTARTLDNCNGRCDMGEGVLSKAGFAAVDDSESMLFDGEGFVAGRKGGDRIDGYLFCYGRDYKAAMKAFYALSGKQPVIPRYALGNWWSRYYAYRQEEYVQLMDAFRDHGIPMSVAVIDMDWHLVKDAPHAGWTGYTWDKKLFPNPHAFGRDLHNRRLKITLNDHPHNGIHAHEESYEEVARFLGYEPSEKTPILFNPTDPKFMDAYLGILHRRVENIACDFWWVDWQQGPYSKVPGVDPLWMLNHFHYLDHGRDGKTPLIFSRYGGPGSHRYPIGFSGDTYVTWDSLQFQPEFTATASNIGYGWWSHDIGGHLFGSRDDELVTRWFQFGVFSPIMRLHSCNSRWMSKEPWLYRGEYSKVMTDFMKLRHRLVPFLYTRNITGSVDDEPLVQPMYWEYPDREEAYAYPNQYTFGQNLIIAPIVQPRDQKTNLGAVKAWLPPGRHVDLFTGTVYDGDREITLYRSLSDYPVLAHEGSIIPLDAKSSPENGCVNPRALEVLVVIGKDGEFNILEDLEDDEEGQEDSEHRQSRIKYNQEEGILAAHVTGREWKFRFLSITSIPKELCVFINGKDSKEHFDVRIDEYPKTPSLVIKCPALNEKTTIRIGLGYNPQLGLIDHTTRLDNLLMDYQFEFKLKDKIWEIVQGAKEQPIHSTISKLMALGYGDAIIGPVAELLLADSRGL